MRKTLKFLILLLCLSSVVSLFSIAAYADNAFNDPIGNRTVTGFSLANTSYCKTQYI